MTEQPRSVLVGGRGSFLCVAVAPDGKLVAAGNKDGSVLLWDPATGVVKATLSGHVGFVFDVAFSPNGRVLASGGGDKTARLWDVASASPLAVLGEHENGVQSVAFTPDGKTLGTATSGLQGMVRLWDLGTRASRVIALYKEPNKPDEPWREVGQIAFSPDGCTLAAAVTKGLLLWDVATEAERIVVPTGRTSRLVISAAGDTLIGNGGDHISLRDPETGRERTVLDDPKKCGPGSSLAISADGKRLVVGYGLGPHDPSSARIWDLAACRQTDRFVTDHDTLRGIAVFPDGETLATVSEEGGVKLWDIAPKP